MRNLLKRVKKQSRHFSPVTASAYRDMVSQWRGKTLPQQPAIIVIISFAHSLPGQAWLPPFHQQDPVLPPRANLPMELY